MRLSTNEINLIKNKVNIIFGETIIYLFGSRIDDGKKGGDIDLYIISEVNEDLFKKKIKLKTILEDLLFKPVDIVIAKDENRLIEKEAMKGIRIL
ncbi:nucleotidyltransferase domain-containing protein [Arcobacter acticola]|uniref:Nucleotidyltransferase domain-containing protein n=1 Tax=Arcobacter acticola TaxID=1849015 RepID=A0A6M8EJG6_9BACT|nr:nucleotidyltransferase domain-containing protein [Arcobacter acticola]QKE28129.1 nucleotidyltransferase domain-containing protein [Arcobacter acticola]